MARPRTGSVYMVKSGWRGRITINTVDGKTTQKSVDLDTFDRAEAEQKLASIIARGANCGPPVSAITTHEQFKNFRNQMEAYEALSARIHRLETLLEQMI